MSGFVYFISAPATNSVKIGFSSTHPQDRLRALQTGNADELSLIGWCDGTTKDERHWHKVYSEYRIRGEWFRLEGRMADFIRAFVQHYWIPLYGGGQA